MVLPTTEMLSKKCTGLRVGVFFVSEWNLQSEDVMNRSIDVRVHEK